MIDETSGDHTYQSLPIDQWQNDVQTAAEDVCRLGVELLKTHAAASAEAQEAALHWKLKERLDKKRAAFLLLIETTRTLIEKLDIAMQQMNPAEMAEASRAIKQNLPVIEEAFMTIRHTSLDLLRWSRRAGRIDGSPLPGEYRESYAKLTSYAPIFKPRLEAFQHRLLDLSRDPDAGEEAQMLLSTITRFNGMMDSERSFVQAIAAPSLELVFQETNMFVEDWEQYSIEDRAKMATRLNECCQFLLYEPLEFHRLTEEVRPRLAEGIESSMYSFVIDQTKMLFSVDEDPIFEQMTVTLYRVVHKDVFADACTPIFEKLYSDFDPR